MIDARTDTGPDATVTVVTQRDVTPTRDTLIHVAVTIDSGVLFSLESRPRYSGLQHLRVPCALCKLGNTRSIYHTNFLVVSEGQRTSSTSFTEGQHDRLPLDHHAAPSFSAF